MNADVDLAGGGGSGGGWGLGGVEDEEELVGLAGGEVAEEVAPARRPGHHQQAQQHQPTHPIANTAPWVCSLGELPGNCRKEKRRRLTN